MIPYDQKALHELLLAIFHVIKSSEKGAVIPAKIPLSFLKQMEINGFGQVSKNGDGFILSGFGEEIAEDNYLIHLEPEGVEMQHELAESLFEGLDGMFAQLPENVVEENTKKVFTLKISLSYVKPVVWRRIKIPGHLSLEDLKEIIFQLFNWSGVHLFEFEINGYEYPMPDSDILDGFKEPFESKDVLKQYQLSGTLGDVGDFTFIYDFGDHWEHVIEVEKVEEIEGFSTPVVEKIHGACPIEDIGGPPMYQHLKQILKSPKNSEYKFMIENYPDGIVSPIPDKDEVNQFLKNKYKGGNLRIVK